MMSSETIAAQTTPPGRGGVGIIRLSGNRVTAVAQRVLKKIPSPRYAEHSRFYDHEGELIDIGLALFFPAPHSFTGEDVLELHGHGGPVVMDTLLQTVLKNGVRLAQPGEFSQRAFLNDKIDLTQAEAIADLIDSSSKQAARLAVRSLQGDFSKNIQTLVKKVMHLRMYVEAAIDFPDEEIDFLSDEWVKNDLENIIEQLNSVKKSAAQGAMLREGLTVVIAGRPNAGKSTLLNALSGRESAIVTEMPGTTRDVMREHIHIDAIPLHVLDTAGLRKSADPVEQEGIRRAWKEIKQADRILFIVDAKELETTTAKDIYQTFLQEISTALPVTMIINKIDLCEEEEKSETEGNCEIIYLSAKTGSGLDLLKQHLKKVMGYDSQVEGTFLARRRHLQALDKTQQHLLKGQQQLKNKAGELLAEDLRLAQHYLGEITGEVTADDLLGQIFSSFCVGK